MTDEDGQQSQDAENGEQHHHDFIEQEREHRLGKLEALADRGIAPYPPKYDRDHSIAEIREKFPSLAAGTDTGDEVALAGRIMLLRRHGASSSPTCTTRPGRSSCSSPRRTRRRGASSDITAW